MTVELATEGTTSLARVTLDGAVYPLVLSKDSEPMVRDVDLAVWLEFSRERNFKKLIARHTALGNIKPIELRSTVARSSRSGQHLGQHETASYLLSQPDALFIATQAKTAMSVKVTKAIIAVFLAYQRGQLSKQAPQEQELLPSGHTALRVVVEHATMQQLEAAAKHSGQRAADVSRWVLRAWSCNRFAEYGLSDQPDFMADLRELSERRRAEQMAALGGAANEKPFRTR